MYLHPLTSFIISIEFIRSIPLLKISTTILSQTSTSTPPSAPLHDICPLSSSFTPPTNFLFFYYLHIGSLLENIASSSTSSPLPSPRYKIVHQSTPLSACSIIFEKITPHMTLFFLFTFFAFGNSGSNIIEKYFHTLSRGISSIRCQGWGENPRILVYS